MNFDDYQNETEKTAFYSPQYIRLYPVLGLCGEAGEIAEKVKKLFRDNNGYVPNPMQWKADLEKEIGDVLWYLAAICRDFDLSLQSAAEGNIEKLRSRQERGVLSGSGDNR
jgi:NTP pyrophosphatase (non-canonical NTP hydrolase)